MLININSDSLEEISKLHGIGHDMAQRIIAVRKENGKYHTPDDLAKVKGISITMALSLSPHIQWDTEQLQEVLSEKDNRC